MMSLRLDEVAARARAWHHDRHTAVCDVVEPWEHGTVVRSTRHPSYHAFNLVRVEDEPGMTARELAEFADEALAGLAHRRVDFDVAEAGDARRGELAAMGWDTMRVTWMHHEEPAPPGPLIGVATVPYEDVDHLRTLWYHDDRPDDDPAAYFAESREVALELGAQTLAVCEDGAPIGYGQLECNGPSALITALYVRPEHRGGGRGAAIVRAAIEAAGDGGDLWIEADDEDRAKPLYERLGFRPVWTMLECTLWP